MYVRFMYKQCSHLSLRQPRYNSKSLFYIRQFIIIVWYFTIGFWFSPTSCYYITLYVYLTILTSFLLILKRLSSVDYSLKLMALLKMHKYIIDNFPYGSFSTRYIYFFASIFRTNIFIQNYIQFFWLTMGHMIMCWNNYTKEISLE